MLLDANVLVYAVDSGSPHHERARAWLEARLNGSRRVGLPWPTTIAFLRLVTSPRVLQRPLAAAEAWGYVEDWLAVDVVHVPVPGPRHADVLADLVRRHHVQANLFPDAHLAALAVEHGLAVCSADGDFARLGVRWENPLDGG